MPKSVFPKLAYEWTNFRISRRDVNENKDNDLEIVDPFFIQNDWFEIDFATCRIKPSGTTHSIIESRIKHTIRVLKLNDAPIIDERTTIIGEYVHDRLGLADLTRLYPFLGREIARQVNAALKSELKKVHS
jgi:hypothetical protein